MLRVKNIELVNFRITCYRVLIKSSKTNVGRNVKFKLLTESNRTPMLPTRLGEVFICTSIRLIFFNCDNDAFK